MARTSGTRRGNGVGKGDGWGGPAKGAGSTEPLDGVRHLSKDEDLKADKKARAEALKDHLFKLATTAERQETQVSAATAWLDREEGKPIARTVTTTVDDVGQLSDLELAAEIARLKREIGDAPAGAGEAEAGKPAGGLSPLH